VRVTLARVCLVVADAAHRSGPLASIGRGAVPLAALLMPAGFFLCAAGREASAANRLILPRYVGVAALAVGSRRSASRSSRRNVGRAMNVGFVLARVARFVAPTIAGPARLGRTVSG
jgi:hypothetical protein